MQYYLIKVFIWLAICSLLLFKQKVLTFLVILHIIMTEWYYFRSNKKDQDKTSNNQIRKFVGR